MTRDGSSSHARLRRRDPAGKTATDLPAWGAAAANRYVDNRYAILFYSLLFTFVASPGLAALHLDSGTLQVLLAANLIIAVFAIRTGILRRVLTAMIIVALAVRFSAVYFGQDFSSALGIWTIVGLLQAADALRSVLHAKSIKSEHIYAALSAYLLAGVSLGVLFWVLERTWPGSMLYGGARHSFSQTDGIYFSFVTLATLGYGDFVPKSELARGMAILEAVAGQLYLGVMVARLVSLYVSEKSD